MSESTLRIVGVKPSSLKKTLNFVVLCNKGGHVWTAEVTIEDLNLAFKTISRTLYLINNFVWTRLESFDFEYLSKLQEEINAFLYQLRFREDVLCHPLIKEILSVPVVCLPLELVSTLRVSDTYSVTSVKLIPEVKTVITTAEYSSVFKGIGKLWSLIESQYYGQVAILGFDDNLFKIESAEVKEQVKTSYWKKNSFEMIFGLDNGSLLVVRFKMKLGPNSKGIYDGDKVNLAGKQFFKVHGSPVVGISGDDDLVLSISTDSILKVSVFRTQGTEIFHDVVGGGSLKQRLTSCDSQGNIKSNARDRLVSLFYDKVTKKVFLGSECGKVLVYLLENSIPKYQYTVSCGETIWDLQVSLGCMYLGVGDSIAVYSDSRSYEILARFRPHIDDIHITTLRYHQSKERIFAGYSNGLLLIWHTVIFQLLVAVKVFDDAITALEIDEKYLLLSNTYSELKMFEIE